MEVQKVICGFVFDGNDVRNDYFVCFSLHTHSDLPVGEHLTCLFWSYVFTPCVIASVWNFGIGIVAPQSFYSSKEYKNTLRGKVSCCHSKIILMWRKCPTHSTCEFHPYTLRVFSDRKCVDPVWCFTLTSYVSFLIVSVHIQPFRKCCIRVASASIRTCRCRKML